MLVRRAHQAGIGHVHPHVLRHGFASRFLENGGTESDLMWLGGGEDAEVIRRYGSAAPSTEPEREPDRFAAFVPSPRWLRERCQLAAHPRKPEEHDRVRDLGRSCRHLQPGF